MEACEKILWGKRNAQRHITGSSLIFKIITVPELYVNHETGKTDKIHFMYFTLHKKINFYAASACYCALVTGMWTSQ
jgi:hypothetical protein